MGCTLQQFVCIYCLFPQSYHQPSDSSGKENAYQNFRAPQSWESRQHTKTLAACCICIPMGFLSILPFSVSETSNKKNWWFSVGYTRLTETGIETSWLLRNCHLVQKYECLGRSKIPHKRTCVEMIEDCSGHILSIKNIWYPPFSCR